MFTGSAERAVLIMHPKQARNYHRLPIRSLAQEVERWLDSQLWSPATCRWAWLDC